MSISEQDKIIFTKNLSVMITSGIPLAQAVLSEAKQARTMDFHRVLLAIAGDIQAGERFSVSLAKHPGVFSNFYAHVVEAGERSGSLEHNLTYLFEQLSSARAFKKELTGALIYPAFIASAVAVVGSLMTYFILPQLTGFLSLYDSASLPFATRVILAFSDAVQRQGALIAVLAISLCVFIYMISTQTRLGKEYADGVRLHLPILGGIFRRAYLVQFSTMLATLLKSGIPLHESLAITSASLDNSVFRKAAAFPIPFILKGQLLSPFLEKSLFPSMYIQLIEVGERSARMEQNLDYLAEFYRKEMEYKMKNILVSLEPILLLLVGGVVLFLAIALFLPLYQTVGTV